MRNLKKSGVLVMILLLLFTDLFSQKIDWLKDETVIDFKNLKEFPEEGIVKYNRKYTFKIENINLNLYKIEAGQSMVDFNTSPPKIFEGISLPSFISLSNPIIDVEELNEIYPGAKSSFEILSVLNEQKEPLKDLIARSIDEINSSSKIFNNIKGFDNAIESIYLNCEFSYNELERNLILEGNKFTNKNDLNREEQEKSIRQVITSAIETAETNNLSLQKNILTYEYNIKNEVRSNNLKIIQPWEKNPVEIGKPNYFVRLEEYEKAREVNNYLTNHIDSLNKVVSKSIEMVGQMKKFKDDNGIQKLINNYRLINPSNFSFTLETKKVKSDKLLVNFKIDSKAPLSCDLPKNVLLERSYSTEGGIKIDFSTGVFINMGNEDFLGREYYYSKISETSTVIKEVDAGSRALLSLGGLMHIYRRLGKKFNLAVSPGVSATSNFDGLNFHLGLSGLIGEENRFILTGGFTAREVSILDKNYSVDTEYNPSQLPSEVSTAKKFPVGGGFFSLTYNLSKPK